VIATSLRPVGRNLGTLSFASTLYLRPILDLLLAEVPPHWQAELRLGLQEALVNAVRHGNNLNPAKQVTIQFSVTSQQYLWIITDQGCDQDFDLDSQLNCQQESAAQAPCCDSECGRGLYILHQIFDRVDWNRYKRQLHLYKQMKRFSQPIIQ